MQKYIVTVMVNGEEFPIKMRANNVKEIEKKIHSQSHIDKVVSIVPKDKYSSPYKIGHFATSSLATGASTTGALYSGTKFSN